MRDALPLAPAVLFSPLSVLPAVPSSARRNSSSGEAEAGYCWPVLGDAGLRASSVSVGDAQGFDGSRTLVCMWGMPRHAAHAHQAPLLSSRAGRATSSISGVLLRTQCRSLLLVVSLCWYEIDPVCGINFYAYWRVLLCSSSASLRVQSWCVWCMYKNMKKRLSGVMRSVEFQPLSPQWGQ